MWLMVCTCYAYACRGMDDLAKKGHNGLQLLAELSKQAANIGHLGDRYTERYLNKNDYKNPQ
jgi:hypothetical protein